MQTPSKHTSKMNKWSTSLPSIISLTSDVQFNYEPIFAQSPSTTTPPNLHNHAGGSLTDLSIVFQTSAPSMKYNQYSKAPNPFYATSIEQETTIRTNHEQFVPHDELIRSLVAYADSFELDSSIYSIRENKHQPTSICPPRRRTQSSTTQIGSMMETDLLMRHKSCEDLSSACSITSTSKPTTVIPRETKFVPSKTHPQFFFAAKGNENTSNNQYDHIQNNPKEKYYDAATPTTTGGSRVDWGFSSDTMNELNKPSTEYFGNYEATTNIGDLNSQILKDLDYFSSMAATMNFSQEIPTPIPPPPPPVVIRKKSKDLTLNQQVDIQLLRPPTPPPPAPIIIREVRHKPPPSSKPTIIHRNLESNGQIRLSKTPPPIVLRERPPLPPKRDHSSNPTIFYRHLPTPPPSPPTVVVERLRPHAANVIQKPAPILVEKWLPYPPEQKPQVIYQRASPLPVPNNHPTHQPSKNIILEYDNVNVIINKDVKQRKEVKRISPDQYVRQFGNSLYSNETLNQILSNSTCKSQVEAEHSHQFYENYTSMYH